MAKTKSNVGFAMISNDLARCGKLTPKAMVTFVCLKSHAGTSNRTWPSHKKLALETNQSVSAVKEALKELKEVGLVSWKGRIRESDGRQTSNNYSIHDSPNVIARLSATTPQSSENHQVEEPLEEKQLNSSSKGRAKVRNVPSKERPATQKQLDLLSNIYIELGTDLESNLTFDQREDLSMYDADSLINELKRAKWKEEAYG